MPRPSSDPVIVTPEVLRGWQLPEPTGDKNTRGSILVIGGSAETLGAVLLAVSRAIGETMIVVMAAGASANLSANPLESMTTVTFQIVAMLTGEGSFDHPATLSAFALGFVLFLVTLALNFIALRVVKRFREAYE